MEKCEWAKTSENMEKYHDEVWGVPIYEDRLLFRKLVLDINQAGLSWQTILNKTPAFDEAFDHFVIEKVAAYDEEKIQELLQNPAIIRNRRKIEAAIHNAQAVQAIQAEFGSFSDYIWHFTSNQTINTNRRKDEPMTPTSVLSDTISSEMKKKGFKFIGSTIIYAYLQAVGIINDHELECFRQQELS
ncbi:DNA-3-methyladenine glycosylase I [Enterococcus sp. BWM-S5]|uniref:DNA-3-methyladenine glycosylase I n=1 Tax=Enterococcus larvae TaxID=2794352 RepID=A0ABS4CHX9_9ENTE|nr:DNA-3-methyladenine glycosylase I [Enterococcus larvae]MBP1045610.1 DNA-3-methyladenine glycosylase I [Enterococcus larvae]